MICRLDAGTRLWVVGSVGGFLAVESKSGKEPGFVAIKDTSQARRRAT